MISMAGSGVASRTPEPNEEGKVQMFGHSTLETLESWWRAQANNGESPGVGRPETWEEIFGLPSSIFTFSTPTGVKLALCETSCSKSLSEIPPMRPAAREYSDEEKPYCNHPGPPMHPNHR